MAEYVVLEVGPSASRVVLMDRFGFHVARWLAGTPDPGATLHGGWAALGPCLFYEPGGTPVHSAMIERRLLAA